LFDDQFRALTRTRPLILGHRGSPRRAKENTLASFRLALESGADGIELDVHRTADGVLVAHHDDVLPQGHSLSELPYDQLLPLAREHHTELPTLEEVFKFVAGRGLLNIELKSAGFEQAVVKLARENLPENTYAFSSFDAQAVFACRQYAPHVPGFLIVFGPRSMEADLTLLQGIDGSGIAYESRFLTDEIMQFFRQRKFPIFAWTVNDPAEAKRLAASGLTGLITDVPEEMVALFSGPPGF
jgi:glycerophosphoryl diester phosphodiesterase